MPHDDWQIDPGRGWGPLELGAPRDQILEQLRDAEIDFDDDEEDPSWLIISELDAEVTFHDDEPFPLLEIAVDNPNLQLNGQPVVGERLHEVLLAVKASSADTLWRYDADPNESLFDRDSPGPSGATDEDLLRRGTLWVRSQGIGLWLTDGVVIQLLLRKTHDVPSAGVGKITASQLEMSMRDDLDIYLQQDHRRRREMSFLQRVAIVLLMIAIGNILALAMKEQSQWSRAPTVEGIVKKVEQGEAKSSKTFYVVSYKDQQENEHEARMAQTEFYIPRAVGDTVQVRYLPEAPDKPVGIARVGDIVFIRYVPWALLALGVFGVVFIFGGKSTPRARDIVADRASLE